MNIVTLTPEALVVEEMDDATAGDGQLLVEVKADDDAPRRVREHLEAVDRACSRFRPGAEIRTLEAAHGRRRPGSRRHQVVPDAALSVDAQPRHVPHGQ